MGLLLVDRRGTSLLILDRLSGDLSGGLRAHIAHLVVGAGGLSLVLHYEKVGIMFYAVTRSVKERKKKK